MRSSPFLERLVALAEGHGEMRWAGHETATVAPTERGDRPGTYNGCARGQRRTGAASFPSLPGLERLTRSIGQRPSTSTTYNAGTSTQTATLLRGPGPAEGRDSSAVPAEIAARKHPPRGVSSRRMARREEVDAPASRFPSTRHGRSTIQVGKRPFITLPLRPPVLQPAEAAARP